MSLCNLSSEAVSFLKKLFIYYLFLAVLGLHCYAGFSLVIESRGYSSCSEWASQGSGFSCCGAQASVVAAHGLSSCGSRALEHRLSSCGARP